MESDPQSVKLEPDIHSDPWKMIMSEDYLDRATLGVFRLVNSKWKKAVGEFKPLGWPKTMAKGTEQGWTELTRNSVQKSRCKMQGMHSMQK